MCVAVGDGHGGARYVRSGIGSQLAVRAAIQVGTACLSDAALLRASVPAASGRLLESWRADVDQHLAEHPLTSEEEAAVHGDPVIAYGSTVLLVVLRGAEAVALQLGDGDIVAGWRDGTAQRPVPEDTRNRAGQTTSLCLPDADRSFRSAVLERDGAPPDVITVSSDGYGNAFANVGWPTAVVADLLRQYDAAGLEAIARAAPQWAADSARVGGDDTTVAFVFRSGTARLPHVPPPAGDAAAASAPGGPSGPPSGPAPAAVAAAAPVAAPVVKRSSAIVGTAVAALVGLGVGWFVGGSGSDGERTIVAATTAPVSSAAPSTTSAPTTTTTTTTRPTTTTVVATTTTRTEPSTTEASVTSTTFDPLPPPAAGDPPLLAIKGLVYAVDLTTTPINVTPTKDESGRPPDLEIPTSWGRWIVENGKLTAAGRDVPFEESWGSPSSLALSASDRRMLVAFVQGDAATVVVYDARYPDRGGTAAPPIPLGEPSSENPDENPDDTTAAPQPGAAATTQPNPGGSP